MNLDLSLIFAPLIQYAWFWLPALILATLFKSPWFKGVMGEWMVNMLARWFLDKSQYHLIKNVTLPTEDGTTQIDHIIVSRFGIFVVETKNMKGWIFGSERQKNWTQKIFKSTHKFQNPLFQNYKHVKTLESCIEVSADHIYSVIVFVGDSTFKTEMPENVTHGLGYIRYIKSKTTPVIDDEQLQKALEAIATGRLTPSLKTHRAHVKHVESIVKEKQSGENCPRCGSAMVRRTIKKGDKSGQEFWGCSTFPKCRGMRKMASTV